MRRDIRLPASERRTASGALAVLTLGSCLLIALASIYIGIRAYTPVLFADEWQVPMDYMISGGHYTIAKLWAQHNEHRIPFQKLLQLADMFWWKTDHRPLLILGWLVQGAQFAAAAFFLRVTSKLNSPEFLTACGLLAFCLFNPNQMQIFEWAFSPSFLGAFFCALVSFGALAVYSLLKQPGWLACAVACAFLAECNLANGVLTWVMLPLCARMLRLRLSVIAALLLCGALGVGVYLIGYQSPSNATGPLEGIRHPAAVFAFSQAYFAESWEFIAPRGGNLAAVAALALAPVVIIHHLLRRHERQPAQAFVLGLVGMMMLTSFLTALGRQVSGVGQAREGRYQVAAMLFWCFLGLWLILRISGLQRFRSPALIAVQIMLLAAVASDATALPRLLHAYAGDGYVRSLAGVGYEAGIFDYNAVQFIYPYPPAVPATYNYLRAQHWIEPPFPEYALVGKPLNRFFSVSARVACIGSTDEIRVLADTRGEKQLVANGWAYTASRIHPLRRLLAVSESGQVMGIGLSGGDRADIPLAIPAIQNRNTGWRIYALAPPGSSQLLVYSILPGTNRVCLLPNSKPIP